MTNWWDDGGGQIAFARGDCAFVAISGTDHPLRATLSTGLMPGRYCDILSSCERTLLVAADGTATLDVPPRTAFATHLEARE